jgi:hypothetical protein
MTQEATQNQPEVSYTTTDPNYYSTLILYDPNAATDSHNFVHWVVTIIKGNDITSDNPFLPYYGPHISVDTDDVGNDELNDCSSLKCLKKIVANHPKNFDLIYCVDSKNIFFFIFS